MSEMQNIGIGWFIQTIVSLGLVAFLFVAFSQFLKRFSATAGVVTGQGDLFKVISRQAFDSKNSMYLIESGDKQYLLFGNPEHMQVLNSGTNLFPSPSPTKSPNDKDS